MTIRFLGLIILTVGAFILGGCASQPSMQSGTWKLRVVGHQWTHGNREVEPDRELMPWRLVEVTVEWRDHRKHGMLQAVEIKSSDPTMPLPSISGFIGPVEKDDSALYLDVIGRDDNARFRMEGAVREQDFVEGRVIGRKRLQENEGFQGKFQLVHLTDEEALIERHRLEREIRTRRVREDERARKNQEQPDSNDHEWNLDASEVADSLEDALPMTPGIWVLRIDGRDSESDSDEYEVLLESTKVYLHVSEDTKSDDLIVKIHFTRGEKKFDPDLQPVTGKLFQDPDDSRRHHLNVLGYGLPVGKRAYDFRLKSTRVSRGRVQGDAFMRDNETGDKKYYGEFSLRRTK